MSNTARWIIAILLILFGIAAAAFAVFGGGISTIGCLESPPDWVLYVLLLSGVITLAGAIVPAVMLIRNSDWRWIALAIVLGFILSCGSYGVYLYLLGQNC